MALSFIPSSSPGVDVPKLVGNLTFKLIYIMSISSNSNITAYLLLYIIRTPTVSYVCIINDAGSVEVCTLIAVVVAFSAFGWKAKSGVLFHTLIRVLTGCRRRRGGRRRGRSVKGLDRRIRAARAPPRDERWLHRRGRLDGPDGPEVSDGCYGQCYLATSSSCSCSCSCFVK